MSQRQTPGLDSLLQRALRRARASEANQAIAEMRLTEGSEDRPALSYEVVVPASGADDYLTQSLIPRLVYFLDCAGFKLPRCPGVFLSLFSGEDLFFIRASDAVDELARIGGLSPEDMVARFGAQSGQGIL